MKTSLWFVGALVVIVFLYFGILLKALLTIGVILLLLLAIFASDDKPLYRTSPSTWWVWRVLAVLWYIGVMGITFGYPAYLIWS